MLGSVPMVKFLLVVAFLLAGPVLAQDKPSDPPAATQKAEKPPVISEVSRLKVENALLRANVEQTRYQRVMAELGDVIKGEIAAFEKAHEGWTFDAQTLVAVKKAPAK
jgi:hypothetical protein